MNWNSEGIGGYMLLKAWGGGLDLGFTQATDKNLFLESSFMDVLNQFVNRARTSDILSLTLNNTIKRFLEYKYRKVPYISRTRR